MKYIMKAGALYQGGKMLARLQGSLDSPAKNIFLADGTLVLQTDIRHPDAPAAKPGESLFLQYLIRDEGGKECAVAKTGHAGKNHAQFLYHNTEFILTMQNRQSYTLTEASGETVVQITHRGLTGGWNIEENGQFPPEIICGIFVFCRYIEHGNEFGTV